MVVGHYQPLADDGTFTFQLLPWCAPSDQTCLLQSVQKTKTSKPMCGQSARFQATGDSLVFGLWELRAPEALVPHPRLPAGAAPYSLLLDLGLAAGILQLFLGCLGVGLVDAFLDRLRRAVDDVLGFLEPQAGKLANRLDHVDLVITDGGQHHGELGLLFGSRRGGSGRRCGSNG